MNAHVRFRYISLALLLLLAGASGLRADITIRLSVKLILTPAGTPPDAGNIGTRAGFDTEIARGNQILAATGRGYWIQVQEYIDIQPPVPAGQAADYWFNLDARANRATIEAAALASTAVWRWNANALNIYVNNSDSGQCSLVGGGLSISLGNTIVLGTVLHELGHFFDLRHTHAGDTDCSIFVPTPPLSSYLRDGDGLAATVPDHDCFTRDQLSVANFGFNYANLSAAQQAEVNTSWLNVMSYHREDQLLDDQMDLWTKHANGARLFVCSGRTWFVSPEGSDQASGAEAAASFATVSRALSSVGGADDVILLRTGTYTPPGNVINTRCTLRATRGPVTVGLP